MQPSFYAFSQSLRILNDTATYDDQALDHQDAEIEQRVSSNLFSIMWIWNTG